MRFVRQWSPAAVTLLESVSLIGACSTSPPKSPEQAQADEATAQRVYASLNADRTYFFRHVDVRVDDGAHRPASRRSASCRVHMLTRRLGEEWEGIDHRITLGHSGLEHALALGAGKCGA